MSLLISDNVCGGVLTELQGTIKSTNFPSPYPDYTECKWHIIAQTKMNWEIQFLFFDLPFESETTCNNYLEIEADDPFDYQQFCSGKRSPVLLKKYFFSGHNVLKIEFSTGRNERQNYGFWLKYFANSPHAIGETLNVKCM